MMIYFGWTQIYIGLTALAISLIVLWKRNQSLSYLFFFSIFWIYLMGVVSVVVFPFPIDISNSDFKLDIHLVPFDFGYCHPEMLSQCIQNLYENILLTIPFGFGINFIARIKPKNISWLALTVGFTFEFVQLIISLAIRSSFRVVDINDVILNAAGVLLGFGIFKIFGWLYLFTTHKFNIQPKSIFAYVYNIITPHLNH